MKVTEEKWMSTNHKNQFENIFKSFDAKCRPYSLFSDFCTMAAASLSNSTRQFQETEIVERRESEYEECAKRYDKGEMEKMAHLLGAVTMALEENPDQDFLGDIYMSLDFGNARTGQYFTPYPISKMMAQMNLENAPSLLKTQRYISICDPCAGGGGMLIAAFNAAKDMGINPQTQCLFHGCDIDGVVLRMAYIQCSLLGMCGHFIHGNSLSLEEWSSFTTPLYHINRWRFGRNDEPGEIAMPMTVMEEKRIGMEAPPEAVPDSPGTAVLPDEHHEEGSRYAAV